MIFRSRRPEAERRRQRGDLATSLDDLTDDEVTELEMGYSMKGLLENLDSVFPDEETRRREWERHRHLLMPDDPEADKPWAWHYYEGAALAGDG